MRILQLPTENLVGVERDTATRSQPDFRDEGGRLLAGGAGKKIRNRVARRVEWFMNPWVRCQAEIGYLIPPADCSGARISA